MEYEIIGLVFTGIVALIASLVLLFLVESIFIWIGAKIAAIEKASFGRAFTSAIAIAFLVPVISALFAFIFPGAGILGLFFGILVIVWILKSIFDTGWVKAFIAWIMSIIGFAITMGIVAIIFSSVTLI